MLNHMNEGKLTQHKNIRERLIAQAYMMVLLLCLFITIEFKLTKYNRSIPFPTLFIVQLRG